MCGIIGIISSKEVPSRIVNSLKKLEYPESYEEIDTRLASGWYVDAFEKKKKKFKTQKVTYKVSRKKN